jgi:hypothetical protein
MLGFGLLRLGNFGLFLSHVCCVPRYSWFTGLDKGRFYRSNGSRVCGSPSNDVGNKFLFLPNERLVWQPEIQNVERYPSITYYTVQLPVEKVLQQKTGLLSRGWLVVGLAICIPRAEEERYISPSAPGLLFSGSIGWL